VRFCVQCRMHTEKGVRIVESTDFSLSDFLALSLPKLHTTTLCQSNENGKALHAFILSYKLTTASSFHVEYILAFTFFLIIIFFFNNIKIFERDSI